MHSPDYTALNECVYGLVNLLLSLQFILSCAFLESPEIISSITNGGFFPDNFPTSPDTFYGLLKVYLATKGRRFVQDIRFNKNFTRVIVSICFVFPSFILKSVKSTNVTICIARIILNVLRRRGLAFIYVGMQLHTT